MSVYLESGDIKRITLKYRVEGDRAYVVGITELKDNPSIPMLYFNTEMSKQTFDEKLRRLKEAGDEAGFDVVVEKNLTLGLGSRNFYLEFYLEQTIKVNRAQHVNLLTRFCVTKNEGKFCNSP